MKVSRILKDCHVERVCFYHAATHGWKKGVPTYPLFLRQVEDSRKMKVKLVEEQVSHILVESENLVHDKLPKRLPPRKGIHHKIEFMLVSKPQATTNL